MDRTMLFIEKILLFVLVLTSFSAHAAQTYYVSQSEGDDGCNGLQGTREGLLGPWKSLSKASAVTFQPGDQLRLKCGDVWNEGLTLFGNAPADNPITITSYGEGERPVIRRTLGNGETCILISHGSGFHFRDLHLDQAEKGIRLNILASANPTPGGYLVENCLFTHISNPSFAGLTHNDFVYMGFAVYIDGLASRGAVTLNGLTIRNCLAYYTQGVFIQMGPVTLHNILLEGNTVSHCSYNGIYQAGTQNYDLINNVLVYGYPWEFHPSGATQVIAGNVYGDTVIRNEVTGNEFGWGGDYPGCPDGCAYDFEVTTGGVTFQNNFIHDTYGEAILFMGGFNHNDLIFDNNLFRNNVRFSPRWDVEIALYPNNTGNGVFSNNRFFARPGIRIFNSKPDSFTYVNNIEAATGTFVEMPLVNQILSEPGVRTYSLLCQTPGAEIRYTLDGSLPTQSSPHYSMPLRFTRSGVLNAKAFKTGSNPSYVNSLAVLLQNEEGGIPTAWWKMDEGTGSQVQDAVGTSSGVARGASWTTGRMNGGLDFDGLGSSVELSHDTLKTLSDTFSVAFWVNPASDHLITTEANTGLGISKTAWWKLDEATGTTVFDSVGVNPGILRSGTRGEGKFGNGLTFNGSSDWVSINNSGLRSVADNFTITCWVNPEATRVSTTEAVTGITGISNQRHALYPLQFSGTSNEAGVGLSVGTNGVSAFELADNHMPSPLVWNQPLSGWNCLALVLQNKQYKLYVNGVLAKTGLTSTKTLHPTFNLGGTDYGWYAGKLDELRVYPYSLNASQVQQVYVDGAAATLPWVLDEGETLSARDALSPVSRGGGESSNHAGMGVSVGTNGISVYESSDEYLPSLLVDTRPLSGWNHIAVIYRNQQPTLYLNGVYEKAGCKSMKTVHPVFQLGGQEGRWFAGQLDDVRIYAHALTDAEIQMLATQSGASVLSVK